MIINSIPESLILEAKKLLSNNKSSHNLEHTERVIRLCNKIGPKEKADMHILITAALLHDIGRIHQDSSEGKICHAQKGSDIAKKLLKKHNYAQTEITNICHCIKTHRYRNNQKPKSIEAKILYDADKIDAIGAIGIGRAFQFSGEIGAKLHNNDVDIKNTEEYSTEDTAYREYIVKLKHIHKKMLTNSGKKLAKKRNKFMKHFFIRLQKEHLAFF